ncbi:hypothetical protein [Stenotrophomonas maltophilia]|uniref:Uncharacterized protein n=1 Tax=Stenotrophomonas maltophilia TaxID=40324 RepID=A0AAI9G205_STEMA|nr:hypothetical protein [Stenotrophomonas maltophilia]EKT4443986.1 hypothetical protein [Stenotrophomonas maltophilia]
MTSKHTPGPWEVAEQDGELFVQVVNQPASCHPMFDRYRIIHGYVGGDPTDNPTPDLGTPEANALLIAAAPELLEALKDLIGWVPGGVHFHTDAPQKAVERASAAIAKATGEGA